MPKFIDDPVGTVLGGIGAGVAGLGKKLGLTGINTGSATLGAEGGQGPLAKAVRQAQQAQAGETPEAKSGGRVGKYSIDGIAKRGKTRAKHK